MTIHPGNPQILKILVQTFPQLPVILNAFIICVNLRKSVGHKFPVILNAFHLRVHPCKSVAKQSLVILNAFF